MEKRTLTMITGGEKACNDRGKTIFDWGTTKRGKMRLPVIVEPTPIAGGYLTD